MQSWRQNSASLDTQHFKAILTQTTLERHYLIIRYFEDASSLFPSAYAQLYTKTRTRTLTHLLQLRETCAVGNL